MKPRLSGIAILLAACAFAGAAQAQVYKCVDANGKAVYLQSPCPKGAKSSTIAAKPSAQPKSDAATADKGKAGDKDKSAKPLTAAEQEQEYRKRQKEKEDADKKAGEEAKLAKEKQEICARSKEQLAALESGRVARVDSKGERYFLDDSQLAGEKARAQGAVTENCK